MLIILVAASVRRASSGAHKSISRIEKQILEKMHTNTKVSHIFQCGSQKSSNTDFRVYSEFTSIFYTILSIFSF